MGFSLFYKFLFWKDRYLLVLESDLDITTAGSNKDYEIDQKVDDIEWKEETTTLEMETEPDQRLLINEEDNELISVESGVSNLILNF